MKIFKKLAFVVIYYLLASLIDQILLMFFGNEIVSLTLTVLCIVIISCCLRKVDILKLNYTQEQRDEYNKSFNSRFTHIVSQLDFKVESVIGVVGCILFGVIPRLSSGVSYGFITLYMLLGPFVILVYIPLFLILNFVVWYMAYHNSFKKKKY